MLELLVTTGIFVLLTSMAIANYPRFRSQISVGRMAREIALATREAQAFGLAVRQVGEETPQRFGVYVDIAEPKQIIIFTENDSDPLNKTPTEELYQPGEERSIFTISGDVSIRDICLRPNGGGGDICTSDGLEAMNIVFNRIDPDAIIHDNISNGTNYEAAYIKLWSGRFPDQRKMVRVWLTGQISVWDDNE